MKLTNGFIKIRVSRCLELVRDPTAYERITLEVAYRPLLCDESFR